MKNSGVNASGSTFIEFDNVEIPVENLVGEENQGFRYIMSCEFCTLFTPLIGNQIVEISTTTDFNPERLIMAAESLRLARICAEDAYTHAITRETFGSKLFDNQIIRAKFSKFGQLIEPSFSFMEQLAYTVESSKKTGQDVSIGGMTALLKVMSTRCLEKVCREPQQVMGGAGYNRSGKGARIEQISRDMRVYAVGGGSAEIMGDLAIRQEIKDLASFALHNKTSKI